MAMSPSQRIGLFVALFAVCCLYFGVVWSFDNGLLMLGNVALLASFGLLLGPMSALSLFVGGARGVLPFLLGIALVFYNFRLIGMLIELYGACLLIMSALPHWLEKGRKLPYIGWLVRRLFPRTAADKSEARRRRRQPGAVDCSDSEEQDEDDDAALSLRPSTSNGSSRNSSPSKQRRFPQLAGHGASVDGSWTDMTSEYDADKESDIQRRSGTGQRQRQGAVGRRSTVAY